MTPPPATSEEDMPKKLTTGQMVALGGGVLMFIALFLPWFTQRISQPEYGVAFSNSGNAFDFTLGWLGSLLVLGAAVLIALKAFANLKSGAGALKLEHFALVLAGVGTLLILIKLIIGAGPSPEEALVLGPYYGVSRGAGVFIALIAGLAVSAGSYLVMKEGGLGLGAFKTLGGSAAPPPPPPPSE